MTEQIESEGPTDIDRIPNVGKASPVEDVDPHDVHRSGANRYRQMFECAHIPVRRDQNRELGSRSRKCSQARGRILEPLELGTITNAGSWGILSRVSSMPGTSAVDPRLAGFEVPT